MTVKTSAKIGDNKKKDWRLPQVDMIRSEWERYQNEIIGYKSKDIVSYVGYEQRDPRGDTIMIFLHKGKYFIKDEEI